MDQQRSCATCGIVASADQLVRRADEWYCPSCAPKGPTERAFGTVVSTGVFVMGLLYLVWHASDRFGLMSIEALPIILAVMIAMTVVHELGHAIAARLTGRSLVGIVIGSGSRRIVRTRVRNVILELRRRPTSGTTHIAGTSGPVGSALFTLGGVLAEALAMFGAWLWEPTSPVGAFGRVTIFIIGGSDIVGSLWPRLVEMPPRGRVPNDGALLMGVLRNADDLDRVDGSVDWRPDDAEAALLAETDTAAEQFALAERRFGAEPDRETVRHSYGMGLVLQGRWREAVEVLAPLESWPVLEGDNRALFLNNLAWSALMTFDEGLVPSAERWSREAAALRPVWPFVSSTRGSALVMASRAAEGLPLLVRAYRTVGVEPKNLALVSGFGALAAHSLGNEQMTIERHAAMVEHDPTCEIRHQVERIIGIAQTAATQTAGTPSAGTQTAGTPSAGTPSAGNLSAS